MNNSTSYNAVIQEYLFMAIKKIMMMLQDGELENYCFYITFDKDYGSNLFPKDVISKNNVEPIEDDKSRNDTTIVLENRFWDLVVSEDGFEVTVEIKEKKERIYVDFESILLFTDQNSNFILDFRSMQEQEDEQENEYDPEIIFVELN